LSLAPAHTTLHLEKGVLIEGGKSNRRFWPEVPHGKFSRLTRPICFRKKVAHPHSGLLHAGTYWCFFEERFQPRHGNAGRGTAWWVVSPGIV